MRHRAKRRDDNHHELAAHAISLGMSWLDTSQLNDGLDGLTGYAGTDVRVEIKDGAKVPSARKLTTGEAAIFSAWKGRTPALWETEADVEETRANLLMARRS